MILDTAYVLWLEELCGGMADRREMTTALDEYLAAEPSELSELRRVLGV